jgi:transcriptional regulator with XRE-family HTH domain
MSAGNLSRLETGDQGPPADETIESIATALGVDAAELLAIAGRSLSGSAFERKVLEQLRDLRDEIRAGFERIEQDLASVCTDKR